MAKKLKNNKLFYFALALFAISLTVFLVNIFQIKLTGYGTIGSVNLTVGSIASINITTYEINFSTGSVTAGQASATLNTAYGNVSTGNWTANSAGLIIQNIGNKNVSVNISFVKTAATFLGGTSPVYQYNFSTADEPNSCVNQSARTNTTKVISTWYDSATAQAVICDPFQYLDDRDKLRIDVKLTVPADSSVGVLTDVITLTFWEPPS